MSCDNDKTYEPCSCGMGTDCNCDCNECPPVNCLEQAIRDALATLQEELEALVKRAEDAAKTSEDAAAASAASASEAEGYRDAAELAATTATDALKTITSTAVVLEETAKKLQEIADELATAIAGIAVVTWYYTTVSEGQTIIPVPEDRKALAVQAIYIEGIRQEQGRGFEYDKTNGEIRLAEPLPLGIEIAIILGTYSDNPMDFTQILASNNGASLVGTSTGKTVQVVLNEQDTAIDNLGSSLLPLLSVGADKLIPSSYGGTVYSDYAVNALRKKGSFGSVTSIAAANFAVYNSADGFWYVSTSVTFPVTVPSAPDSTWRCVGLLNGYPIYDVRNWGLVGDDFTDNTAKWIIMNQKLAGLNVCVDFPAGIFRYTDIGNVLLPRLTYRGQGSLRTAFRCMNTAASNTAFKVDAWPDPADPNQPFLDGFNVIGIHIEGNSNTATVLEIQGLSRSIWDDVTVWGAQAESSVGINLKASSLNNFNNLMCSKYRNLVGQTVNVPSIGIQITTGYRAGAFQGSPSNNLFTNLYMEGMPRGMNMAYGDQNTFIGGSCEANSDYGTNIALGCRYNTFINMGNENLNATTGDFVDKGTYTKFLNCYSSDRFVVQGKNCTIDGGFFERMEIQASAVSTQVRNITVKHWKTADGGFFDSGIGTIKYNIYDSLTPDYINTTSVRAPAPLTTSSVNGGTNGVWDNVTRLPVTFYITGGGGFTQALILRGGAGGDSVGIPLTGVQQIHLEAKDRISLTWSTGVTAPTCSYRPKSGYN